MGNYGRQWVRVIKKFVLYMFLYNNKGDVKDGA